MPLTLRQRLGRRLAALRKARGLTQFRLAELVGRSRDTISLWERGDECCGATDLYTLADALTVDVAALLPEE